MSDIKLNCLYRKVPLQDAKKVLLKVMADAKSTPSYSSDLHYLVNF